ncbi:MAG TPA: MFS transporter [Rhizomicrobium sp.]|nr:MFS transporter [Rhizomicrobium sp.]
MGVDSTYSPPGIGSARRWWIVVILAVGSVIAYADRVNLSFAIIDQQFKNFFLISNTERGFLTSAFFWSYAFLQIPAGWLVDKYGSKYPIAISFVVWSTLTALTSAVTGYGELFAIRLLLGVGEAAMHPASMRWIRFNFSEAQRGLAIGLFMSGSKFGPAIGSFLSALLIEHYGWRAMFFILGAVALLWLIPWLFLVPPDRHTGSAKAETSPVSVPLRKLLLNPIMLGTVLATFSYMYFVYFCLTWMPAYLSEARGLSLGSSGLFTTFSFAGMATVAIVGGWAADRIIASGKDAIKVRKAFTIAGFLLASTECFSAMSASVDVALAISIFSLSGLGLATANYWALTQSLMPSGSVGRTIGVQNCAASVAGIVAPILTGWLVQRTGGYLAAMEAVLAFLLAGILAYLFLIKKEFAYRDDNSLR